MWTFTIGLGLLIGGLILVPLYYAMVIQNLPAGSVLAVDFRLQTQLGQLLFGFGILLAWLFVRLTRLRERLDPPLLGKLVLAAGICIFVALWIHGQRFNFTLLERLFSDLPANPIQAVLALGVLARAAILYGVVRLLLAVRQPAPASGGGSGEFRWWTFLLGCAIVLSVAVLGPLYGAATFQDPKMTLHAARQMLATDAGVIVAALALWYPCRRLVSPSDFSAPTAGFALAAIGVLVYAFVVIGMWSRMVPFLSHLMWNVPGNLLGPDWVRILYLSGTPKILALACICYGLARMLLDRAPQR
jgi:hypothetical protein